MTHFWPLWPEANFGTTCPEVPGSVPTPGHAAEMGQERLSGRTAKERRTSQNGGLHEREITTY